VKFSANHIQTLRWVDGQAGFSRAVEDIFEHHSLMVALRENGLIKRVRRSGFTFDMITKNGRKLLEQQQE